MSGPVESSELPPKPSSEDIYVARLHMEAARATRSGSLASRPSWEIIVTIAGAAAGLGAFLVVMGAAVEWVRLVGAGLPAEEGLATVSKEALAVVGAHVLLVPVALAVLTTLAMNYRFDHMVREDMRAREAGLPRPMHFEDKVKTAWQRTSAWVAAHRVAKYPLYVILVPLCIVALPALLLGRLRLQVVWYIIALPLAAQLDRPSHFPPTDVELTNHQVVRGLRVADDGQTLYLGVSHKLVEVPRRDIWGVTIGHPPTTTEPDAPIVSLVKQIF